MTTSARPEPVEGRCAKVAQALRAAAERLSATSDTARLDAELLMAHALGCSRAELLLRHMRDTAPDSFAELVDRRAAREPVAYIVGEQEFYGLSLEVTPAVLIPRADSETLIEAARELFSERDPPRRILDLGTGSGALLLASLLVWPEAEGLGLDRSIEALFVAIRNAQRHANTTMAFIGQSPPTLPPQRPDRGFARFIQGDWQKRGWRKHLGKFDLILANPPYVESGAPLAPEVHGHEPHGALYSGGDGLEDYRVLVPQLPALLNPDGVAVLEIGHTQGDAVEAIAAQAGFASTLHRDLAGRPRALVLTIKLGKTGPGG